MSQLARRENAPHRAAFVTSLSRWYIRRLLGNLPPFHPSLSAERRPRIAPCGTSPPYGHTPRKSRHGKPFLSSYQCIRNWSRWWVRLSLTIGGNVPNYQGVFFRGYGGQTSYHYGAVGHWSAGLGELQGDGIREIWGELSYLPRSRDGEVGQFGSLAFWNEGRNQWMNDAGKAPSGAMNFYASRSTPVVGKIRPVNRAVHYLIRAR